MPFGNIYISFKILITNIKNEVSVVLVECLEDFNGEYIESRSFFFSVSVGIRQIPLVLRVLQSHEIFFLPLISSNAVQSIGFWLLNTLLKCDSRTEACSSSFLVRVHLLFLKTGRVVSLWWQRIPFFRDLMASHEFLGCMFMACILAASFLA